MTEPEFRQWFRHHSSHFPALASWLAKIPRSGDGATQDGIMRAWHSCLWDVSLEDAQQASTVLFRDHEAPRSFENHPQAVRNIAKRAIASRASERRRKSIVDGEWTVECLTCDDEGLATVWSDSARLACAYGVPADFQPVYQGNWTSVVCQCDNGERWKFSRLKLPRLTPQMLVWNPFDLDALARWASAGGQFADPLFTQPDPQPF